MTAADPTPGWNALAVLHDRIDARVEKALQAGYGLSVREYMLLDLLSRQGPEPGGHLRMAQVADAVALSQSAATRLVSRLEERGLLARYLCPTDRRGIYTEVSQAGLRLLAEAHPTQLAALHEALGRAGADPRLAPLVRAVQEFGAH